MTWSDYVRDIKQNLRRIELLSHGYFDVIDEMIPRNDEYSLDWVRGLNERIEEIRDEMEDLRKFGAKGREEHED